MIHSSFNSNAVGKNHTWIAIIIGISENQLKDQVLQKAS